MVLVCDPELSGEADFWMDSEKRPALSQGTVLHLNRNLLMEG
jgi:hypothetical protein